MKKGWPFDQPQDADDQRAYFEGRPDPSFFDSLIQQMSTKISPKQNFHPAEIAAQVFM